MNKFILFLDILVVLSLVFHIGAITITNIMVEKKANDIGEEVEYHEANPITQEIFNFKEPTKEKKLKLNSQYLGFVFQLLALSLVYACYIWQRYKFIRTKKHLFSLILMVCVIFIVNIFDFANNFGFWLGNRIFG